MLQKLFMNTWPSVVTQSDYKPPASACPAQHPRSQRLPRSHGTTSNTLHFSHFTLQKHSGGRNCSREFFRHGHGLRCPVNGNLKGAKDPMCVEPEGCKDQHAGGDSHASSSSPVVLGPGKCSREALQSAPTSSLAVQLRQRAIQR